MEDIGKILRDKGVEIDLGDHREPEEIALALGIIAATTPTAPSEHPETPVELAKRPKNRPYLAF